MMQNPRDTPKLDQPDRELDWVTKLRISSAVRLGAPGIETNDEREIAYAKVLGPRRTIEITIDPKQDPRDLGLEMASKLNVPCPQGSSPFEEIAKAGQAEGGILLILRLNPGFDPSDSGFSGIGSCLRSIRDNGGTKGIFIFNPEKGKVRMPTELGRIC